MPPRPRRAAPRRVPRAALLAALLLSAAACAGIGAPGPEAAGREDEAMTAPLSTPERYHFEFESAGRRLSLPFVGNGRLDGTRARGARRVLVVFHGLERDPEGYFDAARRAARRAGAQTRRETLIVTPWFLGRREARAARLGGSVPVWRSQAWKEGMPARGTLDDPDVRVTSFAAIDALLLALADRTRFPALEQVVLVGHSAGGQFVQRFAAASDGDATLRRLGVGVRYVVANPSSYLYLDRRRPAPNGGFAVPDAATRAACPGFDTYKYGLRRRSAAMGEGDRAAVAARYGARDVVYLLGERDDEDDHPSLDRSCAALLQGPDRLARGEAYLAYLRAFYGPDIARTHVGVRIPRAGHQASRMFAAPAAAAHLFGIGPTVAGPDVVPPEAVAGRRP